MTALRTRCYASPVRRGNDYRPPSLHMNLIRCTVVDRRGAVSFVAHCDVLSALVAACAASPPSLEKLLDLSEPYYRNLRDYVEAGLAVFDEENRLQRILDVEAALAQGRGAVAIAAHAGKGMGTVCLDYDGDGDVEEGIYYELEGLREKGLKSGQQLVFS